MQCWTRTVASSLGLLCSFGSRGCFDGAQVREIARGQDGARGVRGFEEVLPEGFVGRTEGLGRVIGWAPQAQVLGHWAVGGFVSSLWMELGARERVGRNHFS
ncbi:UDP-sugar:glycosyltransferase [Striga asiatica]|uniref:UDP-sugar:glycosyltransferase n=1 Tax=Striga asiatica TaxID=4170 RepID=A0A5A7RCF3_STRAF|nr:UDP-sugar:glycosyltransferase [Striga asiatica]